jgi:osmoprotectant transport system permease protein
VILGEILVQAAQARSIPATHLRELGGTRLVFNALVAGEIDAYPEYSGTIQQEILAKDSLDWSAAISALKEQGIAVSSPLGFNNSYAIGMLRKRAKELGINRISELRQHPNLRLGFSSEFIERGDGWGALRRLYELSHDQVRGLEHELAYRQLSSGALDVVDVYVTDARVKQLDLVLLEDDRSFFPRYDAVILYRAQSAQRVAASVWGLLEGKLGDGTMAGLNHRVDIENASESDVAEAFLRETFDIQPQSLEPPNLAGRIVSRTIEHLDLVRTSLIPAIFVAIPLGIFANRHLWIGQGVLVLVGIVQTIPALALLVLLMPLATMMGLSSMGVGSLTASVALFLYSLLPIVRGTYTALRSIEPQYLESAAALGLSSSYRLWRIELPMATRGIFSGIKTAAVMNIGFATLGALVGAGGYGQPILTGIRRADHHTILEGAIPAALLAIIVQYLCELIERRKLA